MVGYYGLFFFVVVLGYSFRHGYFDPVRLAVFSIILVGSFMVIVSSFYDRFYMRWSNRSIDVKRFLHKLNGFVITVCFVALYYNLFPEYGSQFYKPYFAFINANIYYLIIGSVLYLLVCDYFLGELDSYYYVSMFLFRRCQFYVVKCHLLSVLLRCFFTPLMFVYYVNDLSVLGDYYRSFSFGRDFDYYFNLLFHFFYTVDVFYGVVGYLFCLRLFGLHIRAVYSSLFSWVVAIICYQPFWTMIGKSYLSYGVPGHSWGTYFLGGTLMHYVWGVLILICVLGYSWSTVVYGCSFSNLTYRRIMTAGPYRYFLHPSYFFKCASYWLISVPFFSPSLFDGLRCSFLLFLVCFIYYLRAKSEESFLLRVSPEYVSYYRSESYFNFYGLRCYRGRMPVSSTALGAPGQDVRTA